MCWQQFGPNTFPHHSLDLSLLTVRHDDLAIVDRGKKLRLSGDCKYIVPAESKLKVVAYIFSRSLLFASVTLTPAMSSQPQADVEPGCDLQVPQMSEKVWTDTMHQTSEVEFPLMPVNPNVKFYICDRCGKRVELLQENLLQIATGNRTLLRRWKAGENVQWFCTPCLATTEGCGIGEVRAL